MIKAIKHNCFLIRVSVAEQREHREKIYGWLFADPRALAMKHNTQAGEIMMIGREAARRFPEAEIGDTLIFHHSIEGPAYSHNELQNNKDRYEGQAWLDYANRWLVQSDNEWRYYIVPCYRMRDMAFGVRKKSGEVISCRSFIFATQAPETQEDLQEEQTEGGLIIFKRWIEKDSDKRKKIEDIMVRVKSLATNLPYVKKDEPPSPETIKKIEMVSTEIERLMGQQEQLTRELNARRCVPYIPAFKYSTRMFGNKTPTKLYYYQTGSEVLTVNISEVEYCVLRPEWIYFIESIPIYVAMIKQQDGSFVDSWSTIAP